MSKKTLEQFKKDIKEKFNDEFEVVSPVYLTRKQGFMQLKHKKCGYDQIFRRENDLLHKKGKNNKEVTVESLCPICYKAGVKKNQDKALQYYFDYNHLNITILKYDETNKEFTVKCNKCGEIAIGSYSRFRSSALGCICNPTNPKYNKDNFPKKIYSIVGDEYTLLSEYKGSNQPITLRHNCIACNNHEFTISQARKFTEKNNPQRCPICSKIIGNEKRVRKLVKTQSQFLKEVKEQVGDEYTPLDSYINGKTKIRWRHNIDECGKVFKQTPLGFLGVKQHRCSYCAKRTSKKEEKLLEFIKENYNGEIKHNARNIIHNEVYGHKLDEIDIYLPELKLAIEFDGIYWHSDAIQKVNDCGENYHLSKTKACQKEGIRMIHIFEDEWDNKQELVKRKILHMINKSDNVTKKLPSIRASKCIIDEVTPKDETEFLNEHHIQGLSKNHHGLIRLGLWYPINEDELELVAIMTFVQPRKSLGRNRSNNKKKYDYELYRFATNLNYRVNGAFGKLFKYFKDNYEWNFIITYADLRWSDMNYENTIYCKNGFTFSHRSRPSYKYNLTNLNKLTLPQSDIEKYKQLRKEKKQYLEGRFKFQKSQLHRYLKNFNPSLTEHENMKNHGCYRIYDCGELVFEYTKDE